MKRLLSVFVLFALILTLCPVAFAEETPVEIHTVEDLQAMAENPAGSYVLMADLDLAGIEWMPVDLVGGSFDGNGHTILNLTITQAGATRDISYDGNRKTYDTTFAGLFGVLRDASVKNLHLLNVRGNVVTDQPCFLGSIAGAAYDSQVIDCTVAGTLQLQAFDRMFGVGGVVGYGSGLMERCTADVTLICIDTGKDTLDEQFLGGAFATGFIDVVDCDVTINGYVSEYGYVHNGGLIGMIMQYPLGNGRKGVLSGNTVKGQITFFECNKSRRAYCEAFIGETLASYYSRKSNTSDFKRNEIKSYDVILLPEMCENPVYTEEVVPAGCDTFGYTTYTCEGCGYSYTDHYTLYQHTVTQWSVTVEPSEEETGISAGNCDNCGMEFTREEPKLEPTEPPTTVPPTTEPPTEPTEPKPVKKIDPRLDKVCIIAAVVLLALALLWKTPEEKAGKFQDDDRTYRRNDRGPKSGNTKNRK